MQNTLVPNNKEPSYTDIIEKLKTYKNPQLDVYIGINTKETKLILSFQQGNDPSTLRSILSKIKFDKIEEITQFLYDLTTPNMVVFSSLNIHYLYNETKYIPFKKITNTQWEGASSIEEADEQERLAQYDAECYHWRDEDEDEKISDIIKLLLHTTQEDLCTYLTKHLTFNALNLIFPQLDKINDFRIIEQAYLNAKSYCTGINKSIPNFNIYISITQDKNITELLNPLIKPWIDEYDVQWYKDLLNNLNKLFNNNSIVLNDDKLIINFERIIFYKLDFITTKDIKSHIIFNHCRFYRAIQINKDIKFNKLTFNNCLFENVVDIDKNIKELTFQECEFEDAITINSNIVRLNFINNKYHENYKREYLDFYSPDYTIKISGNINELSCNDNQMKHYQISIHSKKQLEPSTRQLLTNIEDNINPDSLIMLSKLIILNNSFKSMKLTSIGYRSLEFNCEYPIIIQKCKFTNIAITKAGNVAIEGCKFETLKITRANKITILTSQITSLLQLPQICDEINLKVNFIDIIKEEKNCQWSLFKAYSNQINTFNMDNIQGNKEFYLKNCILNILQINNSTFESALDLTSSIILNNLSLVNCTFKNSISFFNTHLGGYVDISSSLFEKDINVEQLSFITKLVQNKINEIYENYIDKEHIMIIYSHVSLTSDFIEGYKLQPMQYTIYFKSVKEQIKFLNTKKKESISEMYIRVRKTMNRFKSSLYKADNYIDGAIFYNLELMAYGTYLSTLLKLTFMDYIHKFAKKRPVLNTQKDNTIQIMSNKQIKERSNNDKTILPPKANISFWQFFVYFSHWLLLNLSRFVSSYHQNTLQAIIIYAVIPLVINLFRIESIFNNYLQLLILPTSIFNLIITTEPNFLIDNYNIFVLSIFAIFQTYVLSQIFIIYAVINSIFNNYLQLLILPTSIFNLIMKTEPKDLIDNYNIFLLSIVAIFQTYVLSQIFISAKSLIKRN